MKNCQEQNGKITAFKNNLEHLEYIEFIARLYVAVAFFRPKTLDEDCIKALDLADILETFYMESEIDPVPDQVPVTDIGSILKYLELRTTDKINKSIQNGVTLNFEKLCQTYRISGVERKILILLFAHNTGKRFKILCREFEKEMTVGTILYILFPDYGDQIKNRHYFSITGKLRSHNLIKPSCYYSETSRIIDVSMDLDEPVENFIIGDDHLYDSDLHFIKSEKTSVHMDSVVLRDNLKSEILSQAQHFILNQNSEITHGVKQFFGYGVGLTFFFYGPSGTGKTMMAHALATTLRKELLIIDSNAVSDYHRDLHNILGHAFRESKLKDGLLFFDECDDLFQNDSYASRALLIELEKAENITIFAANKVVNIDPALDRRITMKIPFDLPDTKQRELIWESLTPPGITIAEDVDFKALSEKYLFSGGVIKNTILTAINTCFTGGDHPTVHGHTQIILNRKDLINAADHQARSLFDLNLAGGRVYMPEKEINALDISPLDKKKIKRLSHVCKQACCKDKGVKFLLTAADVKIGIECVEALASKCSLEIRQFNFENIYYEKHAKINVIDPVTQQFMGIQDLIFRSWGCLPYLILLVDDNGALCDILSKSEKDLHSERFSFFNKVSAYGGILFVVTKPIGHLRLPFEFDHNINIHTPSGESQIKRWESYLGKEASIESYIIDLVEAYPLHVNEIDLIAEKAELHAFLDTGKEEYSLDSIYRVLKHYTGVHHTPLLFGRGKTRI